MTAPTTQPTIRYTADRRPVNPRSYCLHVAESLVNGERNVAYDDPHADFTRTAAMWAAYLGVTVEKHDVAVMMALLKVSRIRWSPGVEDHWFDLAGYAACGYDVRPVGRFGGEAPCSADSSSVSADTNVSPSSPVDASPPSPPSSADTVTSPPSSSLSAAYSVGAGTTS